MSTNRTRTYHSLGVLVLLALSVVALFQGSSFFWGDEEKNAAFSDNNVDTAIDQEHLQGHRKLHRYSWNIGYSLFRPRPVRRRNPAPVVYYVPPPPRPVYRPPPPPSDIVDTAVSNGLTTLVELVQAAGLEDTLRGDGPFTVFAPTNAAFSALPAATLDALTANATSGDLANILLYHVLPGQSLRTIGNAWRNGGPFTTATTTAATNVTTSRYRQTARGPLVKKVNDANVVVSDVSTSNGVVHVIDALLLPP